MWAQTGCDSPACVKISLAIQANLSLSHELAAGDIAHLGVLRFPVYTAVSLLVNKIENRHPAATHNTCLFTALRSWVSRRWVSRVALCETHSTVNSLLCCAVCCITRRDSPVPVSIYAQNTLCILPLPYILNSKLPLSLAEAAGLSTWRDFTNSPAGNAAAVL